MKHELILFLCLISFLLAAIDAQTGTFTDERDGQRYEIIKIGGQWWMAENLNYVIPREKTAENVAIQDEIGYDASHGYPPSNRYRPVYGQYYTYEEAMHCCPEGWRLPSVKDWEALFEEVGGKEIAGARLASRSKLWDKPFDPAIQPSGFNIEPAGYRFYILFRLWETGNRTFFWSSDTLHTYSAIGFDFHAGYSKVFGGTLGYRRENAISVRCIKEN